MKGYKRLVIKWVGNDGSSGTYWPGTWVPMGPDEVRGQIDRDLANRAYKAAHKAQKRARKRAR